MLAWPDGRMRDRPQNTEVSIAAAAADGGPRWSSPSRPRLDYFTDVPRRIYDVWKSRLDDPHDLDLDDYFDGPRGS